MDRRVDLHRTIYVVGVSQDNCQFYVHGAQRLGEALGMPRPRVVGVDHPEHLRALAPMLGDYDALLAVENILEPHAVATTIEHSGLGRAMGVFANYDATIDVAIEVSARFGVPMATSNPHARPSDKSLLRLMLSKLGYDHVQPRYAIVESVHDVVALGFPAVVKSDMSSGSRGTFVVRDAAEAQLALQTLAEMTIRMGSGTRVIVAEQFIPGDEYSVQALVRGGVAEILTYTTKKTELSKAEGNASLSSVKEVAHVLRHGASLRDDRFIKAVTAAAEAMGCDNGPMQLDLMDALDGTPLRILDAAIRPSGGNMPLVMQAMGIDFPLLATAALLDVDVPVPPYGVIRPCAGRVSLRTNEALKRAQRLQRAVDTTILPNPIRRPSGPIAEFLEPLYEHRTHQGTFVVTGDLQEVHWALDHVMNASTPSSENGEEVPAPA